MIRSFMLTLAALMAVAGTTGDAKAGESVTRAAVDIVLQQAKAAVQVDPAAGRTHAVEAASLATRLENPRERQLGIASAKHLMGEAEVRLDNLSGGKTLILTALETARGVDPKSKVVADVLLSKGSVDAMQGNVADALAAYQRAYYLYRDLGERRSEAVTLTYLASLYSDARDNQTALRYSELALATFSADARLRLAMRNNRGAILQDLGRYNEAEREFGRALQLAQRLGEPLPLAQLWGNISRNRIKAGRSKAAEDAIRTALTLAQKDEAASRRPQLLAIAAEVALRKRDVPAAARLISQSFAGVDVTRTTLLHREAHDTAYRAYRATGRTDEALVNLIALKRLDDEATKLATTTGTALMGARFDFANQELRIARLRAEELRRSVAAQRKQVETERLIVTIGAAATALVIALLAFALFTVRRSRNKVSAAADDLAITNTALSKALAAKTEFLATTSHEIRTPLNGILGMTQVMLTDRALPAETRDRLSLVQGAGEMMRALVDDILDVAKMETGNLSIEHAPYDPAAVLRDAAAIWEEQARSKGLAFAIRVDDLPRMIVGDAARVRQIAFNLLGNALKFTEKGSVTMTARSGREGTSLVLTVSDTGVGIAADKQEVIFDSFRQADASTTRRFGGSGLGLSICRNLARAMDGDIAVTSVPDEGSTFTVTLPMVKQVDHGPCDEIIASGATVLVVEGRRIMQGMWRSLLEPHAGMPAFADDAEAAVAVLSCGQITRVLVDEAAAGDGVDRILAAARGAEVTLLWPDARRAECDMLIASGVARVLLKPVTGPHLVATLFPDPIVSRAA